MELQFNKLNAYGSVVTFKYTSYNIYNSYVHIHYILKVSIFCGP